MLRTKKPQTNLLKTTTTSLKFTLTAFLLATALLASTAFLTSAYHVVVYLVACAVAPLFLFVLPTVTLLLCVGVVFLKHPVHNLLCLISVFFSTVVLYLYVGAEFLAFLFLIVYVGAIAILFLFVIMLLQIKIGADGQGRLGSARAKIAAFITLATVLGLNDTLATSLSQFLVVSDNAVFKTVARTTEELI